MEKPEKKPCIKCGKIDDLIMYQVIEDNQFVFWCDNCNMWWDGSPEKE